MYFLVYFLWSVCIFDPAKFPPGSGLIRILYISTCTLYKINYAKNSMLFFLRNFTIINSFLRNNSTNFFWCTAFGFRLKIFKWPGKSSMYSSLAMGTTSQEKLVYPRCPAIHLLRCGLSCSTDLIDYDVSTLDTKFSINSQDVNN